MQINKIQSSNTNFQAAIRKNYNLCNRISQLPTSELKRVLDSLKSINGKKKILQIYNYDEITELTKNEIGGTKFNYFAILEDKDNNIIAKQLIARASHPIVPQTESKDFLPQLLDKAAQSLYTYRVGAKHYTTKCQTRSQFLHQILKYLV